MDDSRKPAVATTNEPRRRAATTERLPSLDFLKGFDAAVRRGSFTRAAEEMFLTQSALSRQIQTLEEQLGVQLFERAHRQIVLTEAGRTLHETTQTILREMRYAV